MTDASFPGRSTLTQDGVVVSEVTRRDFVELYVTGLPRTTAAHAASAEARALYASIATILASREALVVQERLFGALTARAGVLPARRDAIAGCASFGSVPPTYLEGLPCDGDGLAGVHLWAIAPAVSGGSCPVVEIVHEGLALGRLVEPGGLRHAYLSGVTGTTPDRPLPPPDQAWRMFETAERILGAHGFSYPQVVRTWIYIGDILAWYGSFNAVRTQAYRGFGVISDNGGRLPASTGIQGRSPGEIACVMDLLAASAAPGADLAVNQIHNPLQNEAYAYGSSFSRAMEVVTGGARTVYVSGTASIDEWGKSIHGGEIDGQIERTVENIEALIGTRGLTLDHIRQATVFLKRPADLGRFRSLCADTAFRRLGVCMVADVCREELLFEIDAVATGPA
jgi:enamine deaminase RidA (YjgF/YER057c/UK114 family)